MSWEHEQAVFSAAAVTADFLTLADIKAQCRIDSSEEDTLLSALGRAAVAHVERATGRLMVQRTCVLRLPTLPTGRTSINLPGGAVSSVTSIEVDGSSISLTGLEIIGDSPAQIAMATDWPTPATTGWPVRITYVAGYMTAIDAPELRIAALMLAGDLYERREAQIDVARVAENPVVAAMIGAVRIIPR